MLNATATACVFKFYERNPKMIKRWPSHVTATRRTRSTIPDEPPAEVKRQAKPPERLQQALVVLDVRHDVKVYPNSGHRFMSQASGMGAVFAKILRLTYNEEDAADAWRRIYAFFDAELGGAAEVTEADQADS